MGNRTGNFRVVIPAGAVNFSCVPYDESRKGLILKNDIGGGQVDVSFGTTSDQGISLAPGEALPQFQDNAVPPDEIFAGSTAGTTLQFVFTYKEVSDA